MDLEKGSDGYRMIFGERDISLYRTFRHELGNPVTVISGYLEESERHEEPENPFMKEISQNRQEVEQFLTETNKVLDSLDKYNWMPPQTAQRLEGYSERFERDLGTRVDNVVEMVSCLKDYQEVHSDPSGEQRIELNEITEILEEDYNADISYELPKNTEVNANQAAKIISKTTGENWRKYGSETENALEDEEAELKATVYQDKNDIVFRVGDNGPGLNGETPEEIFEKDHGKGTGFGLYISREITETFNGNIEYCQEASVTEEGFGYELRLKKA